MKNIFISDLKNYYGKEIVLQAYLKGITLTDNRTKKRQEILISDKSGEITINAWAELINDKYYELEGKIVKIMGQVGIYQNIPDIQIIGMDEVKEYDWRDYVQALPPEDIKQYSEALTGFINMMENPNLKALLEKILDEGRKNKMACAIGGTLHHNYYGGLLVHTVETCKSALQKADEKISGKMPYGISINRDLVIAGALLHDIGKLNSYGCFPKGERTMRGLLVNSSVESVLFATMYNSMLPKDMQVKDLSTLDHILLTAESTDEKGYKPRTIEAEIVNLANTESVKTDGFGLVFHNEDRRLSDHKTSLYSKLNQTVILREV